MMNTVIMWVMACGAVLGGLDRILGNRFGLGKRFEEGFELLGATALSMAGIICLVPLLTLGLEKTIVPFWNLLGLDPAMLGGIIAIDMGGFQLAGELAADPKVASYAGILVAATLGCTVTFTIPVGMGMVPEKDRPLFARGILFGLILLPVSLFLGGILTGLTPLNTIHQSLPVFLACFALALGIVKWPDQLVRGFLHFSNAIRLISTLGLIFGAFAYMTGVTLPFPMTPLEEAMKTVSSIGIVMLGSLSMAELLQRILKAPLAWLGKKTGMNSASMTGLLLGGVSVVPAIALIRDMDRRGKIVNAAFLVSAASALAAHLGFTFGVQKEMVMPLLAVKFVGGILGGVTAYLLTGKPVGTGKTG